MTDTAFQGDAFQGDAFQIGASVSDPVADGGNYTYVPNSKTAKKIRKLLERLGEPLASEFEAKAPVVAEPADIPWPEGYRTREKRVLPQKAGPALKWWDDVAAPPALPKQAKFEWWKN
jgi:hypothetical protein